MKLKMNGMRLGPLPHRKNAVDVFGDFLGYLFRCTRDFIVDTHANGAALWHVVEHDLQFVRESANSSKSILSFLTVAYVQYHIQMDGKVPNRLKCEELPFMLVWFRTQTKGELASDLLLRAKLACMLVF